MGPWLTQAELAKRARVRVETLSRLEHAKHSPNVATVDKIVRAWRKRNGKLTRRRGASMTKRRELFQRVDHPPSRRDTSH